MSTDDVGLKRELAAERARLDADVREGRVDRETAEWFYQKAENSIRAEHTRRAQRENPTLIAPPKNERERKEERLEKLDRARALEVGTELPKYIAENVAHKNPLREEPPATDAQVAELSAPNAGDAPFAVRDLAPDLQSRPAAYWHAELAREKPDLHLSLSRFAARAHAEELKVWNEKLKTDVSDARQFASNVVKRVVVLGDMRASMLRFIERAKLPVATRIAAMTQERVRSGLANALSLSAIDVAFAFIARAYFRNKTETAVKTAKAKFERVARVADEDREDDDRLEDAVIDDEEEDEALDDMDEDEVAEMRAANRDIGAQHALKNRANTSMLQIVSALEYSVDLLAEVRSVTATSSRYSSVYEVLLLDVRLTRADRALAMVRDTGPFVSVFLDTELSGIVYEITDLLIITLLDQTVEWDNPPPGPEDSESDAELARLRLKKEKMEAAAKYKSDLLGDIGLDVEIEEFSGLVLDRLTHEKREQLLAEAHRTTSDELETKIAAHLSANPLDIQYESRFPTRTGDPVVLCFRAARDVLMEQIKRVGNASGRGRPKAALTPHVYGELSNETVVREAMLVAASLVYDHMHVHKKLKKFVGQDDGIWDAVEFLAKHIRISSAPKGTIPKNSNQAFEKYLCDTLLAEFGWKITEQLSLSTIAYLILLLYEPDGEGYKHAILPEEDESVKDEYDHAFVFVDLYNLYDSRGSGHGEAADEVDPDVREAAAADFMRVVTTYGRPLLYLVWSRVKLVHLLRTNPIPAHVHLVHKTLETGKHAGRRVVRLEDNEELIEMLHHHLERVERQIADLEILNRMVAVDVGAHSFLGTPLRSGTSSRRTHAPLGILKRMAGDDVVNRYPHLGALLEAQHREYEVSAFRDTDSRARAIYDRESDEEKEEEAANEEEEEEEEEGDGAAWEAETRRQEREEIESKKTRRVGKLSLRRLRPLPIAETRTERTGEDKVSKRAATELTPEENAALFGLISRYSTELIPHTQRIFSNHLIARDLLAMSRSSPNLDLNVLSTWIRIRLA